MFRSFGWTLELILEALVIVAVLLVATVTTVVLSIADIRRMPTLFVLALELTRCAFKLGTS